HDEMVRDFLVGERFGARSNPVAVDPHAGERRGLAARRNQDVLCFDLSGALSLDRDASRTRDSAASLEARHLVLLEEEIDALRSAIDHSLLPLQHRREIEADLPDLDSVRAETLLGFVVALARFEHRLARDASDPEARSTERRIRFHTGDVEA